MNQIKSLPLSKLQNWGNNYRHGDIPSIELSIRTFGFNNPVGVANDVVYVGNQRLAALREMHRTSPENPPHGIKVRGSDWLVPAVDLSHLNENELLAYAIADNRTHDRGADDEPQLAKLLSDLAGDPDLELATGYTESDILDLLDSLRGPDPKEPAPPRVVDPTNEEFEHVCPRCKFEFNS